MSACLLCFGWVTRGRRAGRPSRSSCTGSQTPVVVCRPLGIRRASRRAWTSWTYGCTRPPGTLGGRTAFTPVSRSCPSGTASPTRPSTCASSRASPWSRTGWWRRSSRRCRRRWRPAAATSARQPRASRVWNARHRTAGTGWGRSCCCSSCRRRARGRQGGLSGRWPVSLVRRCWPREPGSASPSSSRPPTSPWSARAESTRRYLALGSSPLRTVPRMAEPRWTWLEPCRRRCRPCRRLEAEPPRPRTSTHAVAS
mmetsp:Transcript_49276/g.151912  ORF Transcript_49276/g.151912 Transcript_49276/m.151912 type:complete len:255 (+) Transcript_49276:874-1638(+)